MGVGLSIKRMQYTIFPKLVFAFLAVIVPFYTISLLINRLGEQNIRDEVSRSMESRVSFYLKSLETEKMHMVNMLNEAVLDKDLQHFTYVSDFMERYVWSETVERVENKLRSIKGASIYIKSVDAHILTLGRTLSSDASITDALLAEYEAVQPAYKRPDANFYYWQERMFLALSYPASQLTKKPGFVISIEMNLDVLRDTLLQFADYDNSGAVLFNPGEGLTIANGKDKDALPVLRQFLTAQYGKGIWAGTETIDVNGRANLVTYRYSPQYDSFLLVYVPAKEVFGANDRYRFLLWMLSLAAAVTIVCYSYWIYRLIHRPLQKLVRSFRRVEEGQMEPMPLRRKNDEFMYLFQQFNKMVEKLRILIHEVYEQKIRAQSSELKQLQSQINPHFLYNTYFILYRLAKINDNDKVMMFSQYLGEYFQYITRNSGLEVALADEVQHTRTYVEIQNIRFYNRIKVEFAELPERCKQIVVPKLILQPVIENAYKYGVGGKMEDGVLKVGMEVSDDMLLIHIEDNGDELTDEQLAELADNLRRQGPETEYTGLLNVNRRLQIKFDGEGGVRVSRGAAGGLRVTVHIPCA